MRIRKTKEEDVKRVMEIYAYARKFMAEHGNPNQWGPTNWPPESLIHRDIENGKGYVCLNDEDEIIGSFFLDYGTNVEKTYDKIYDGEWEDFSDYGVVHRIAGDGSLKGIGEFCINWAYEQCGHLRMDTYEDNIVMINLLTKLGFDRRGIIYIVEDDLPRIAFEKNRGK